MSRKTRTMLTGLLAIAGIWLAVWGGYWLSQNAKMTAEKVRQYANSLDLAKLSGLERAEALRKLEEKINGLSLEERRKWRRGDEWKQWFNNMTENEKGQFIEATMPTGFKQMLTAFEDLPQDKRKKAIDSTMKRLRESQEMGTNAASAQAENPADANSEARLSPELEKKAMTIGLKAFYTESSAQTKAELAPFLEELQHQMQSGRPLRPN